MGERETACIADRPARVRSRIAAKQQREHSQCCSALLLQGVLWSSDDEDMQSPFHLLAAA